MLKFLVVPVLIATGLVGATSTAALAAPSGAGAGSSMSAQTALSKLHVRAESHAKTYKSSRFGGWIDANGDGEDTRAEVLKAESQIDVTDHDDGTPWLGLWDSPYDGRSTVYASRLQVDHLVPLKEAWTSGAWNWSAKKREAYANDLGYGPSLMAVSKSAAKAKGNKEPGAYLPSDVSFRCTYVKDWIAVKWRWHLSVDAQEKSDLASALDRYCTSTMVKRPASPAISRLVPKVTSTPDVDSSTPVATDPVASTPVASTPVVSAPVTAAPTPIATIPSPVSTSGTYYADCDAVRAAGAAPLFSWEAGYRSALDADSDGIACEDSGSTTSSAPITTTPITVSPISSGGAICRDGSISSSTHRSGTCSHHGGVSTWL